MKQSKFYSLGKLIYQSRFVIVMLTIILVVFCIPLVPKAVSHFTETGFVDPNSESAKADKLLDEKLAYHHNSFIVVYRSKVSFDGHPGLYKKIHDSLRKLKEFPVQIVYPDDNEEQVSKDKHTAYAVVVLKGNKDISAKELAMFKAAIEKPPGLTM